MYGCDTGSFRSCLGRDSGGLCLCVLVLNSQAQNVVTCSGFHIPGFQDACFNVAYRLEQYGDPKSNPWEDFWWGGCTRIFRRVV